MISRCDNPATALTRRGLLIREGWAVLAISMCCAAAFLPEPVYGAVSLLGVQYQQDDPLTEFQCYWKNTSYPTSCGVPLPGANLHVFIRNDGTSAVTLDSVSLVGYSLKTILKEQSLNGHITNSIWFYWDNPPQAILDAGEPAWYKLDPVSIPAGGAGQVIIRLRRVPVTTSLAVDVDTSANILNTTLTVDANAPTLANISYSADLKTAYLYWRRSGGAAPATVKMDGTDVTSITTTVGDAGTNFAVSVVSLSAPLSEMSYHVFQGLYSDGTTATGGTRVWVNPFTYTSWAAFDIPDGNDAMAQSWLSTCADRGLNTLEMTSGSSGLMDYLGTSAGKAYADSKNYGLIKDSSVWGTWSNNPRMWFIDDEPDGEEANLLNNFCGTGYKLPCSSNQAGTMGMHYISVGEDLRAIKNRPTTINMDGTWKPYSYYSYGQLSDCLCIDHYYQPMVRHAYTDLPNTLPLYRKATVVYATARAGAKASEPNPSRQLLYSCSLNDGGPLDPWPWAAPETKRIEAYYAMAAGAKGLGYWWFKKNPSASNGLGGTNLQPQDPALWEEIGLIGAEIKSLQPYLVTSNPVDLNAVGSTNVWVRGLARGTNTLILFVVTDDYYNDQDFHGTPVANASVTVGLPAWMASSPTAFEFARSGISTVSTSQNGSNLVLNLGTLNVAKIVFVTVDPQLRMTLQQRYDQVSWPGICNFAPTVCHQNTSQPSIIQHPASQNVLIGASTTLTIVAGGGSQMGYQWQKNSANLADGGHYSGCTTPFLTVSQIDNNDVASYRCIVTNPYGTATSNDALLSLGGPTGPSITQHPTNQSVTAGASAGFTVAAGGTAPLSYQWQKNQANLTNGGHYSGVTSPTLTITSADNNDVASYRCVVTNSYGTATSNEASLSIVICVTPTLVNGNFEGGNSAGIASNWIGYTRATVPSTVAYTIQIASPAEGLQYQQIQTSYVATGGAGVYQVITGCASGANYTISGWMRTNSANGRATVKVAPNGSTSYSNAIDLSPAATTTSNTWITFSGTVTATSSTMTLFLDCQTYVSGSTAKAAAFDGLTVTGCAVGNPPSIAQHPGGQNICSGAGTNFSVTATGDAPLSYQWQKNQVNLSNGGHYSGVTTSTLTVSNADTGDVAGYRCVVTNNSGSANSNAASLTLKAATAITEHPQSQIAFAGGTASFTVTATGDSQLTYQWQKNGVDLAEGGHYSDVTMPTLTISNADGNDVADYRCMVTAGCGTATSNQATLTLGTPLIPGDFDHDGDVDLVDFGHLQNCFDPQSGPLNDPNCADANLNGDLGNRIDQDDLNVFLGCMTGADVAGNPSCAN